MRSIQTPNPQIQTFWFLCIIITFYLSIHSSPPALIWLETTETKKAKESAIIILTSIPTINSIKQTFIRKKIPSLTICLTKMKSVKKLWKKLWVDMIKSIMPAGRHCFRRRTFFILTFFARIDKFLQQGFKFRNIPLNWIYLLFKIKARRFYFIFLPEVLNLALFFFWSFWASMSLKILWKRVHIFKRTTSINNITIQKHRNNFLTSTDIECAFFFKQYYFSKI